MATLVGTCPRSPFHGGTIDAIAARVNALVRNTARAEAMGKPGAPARDRALRLGVISEQTSALYRQVAGVA